MVEPMDCVARSARFSRCGRYRYRLTRQWGPGEPLVFVMLNPSTADAERDDPTIRKCIGFARRLGFHGVDVVNLFAYRATSPRALWAAPPAQRQGPGNRKALAEAFAGKTVVLAWGAHARRAWLLARRTERAARRTASRVRVLKRLSDGIPAHPLMLPYACAAQADPCAVQTIYNEHASAAAARRAVAKT